MKIGIIAEENNDVEVIYELTCKIIQENAFTLKHWVGHGGGKIKRKCAAWAKDLLSRGCSHLVVMHDLDRAAEKDLRDVLERCVRNSGFRRTLILIPIEEIEAWLLSDAAALESVFNMRRSPILPHHPERIASPKEALAEIVEKHSNARYLNTVHNRPIAKALNLNSLSKCPSFSGYSPFITAALMEETSRKLPKKHRRLNQG